MSILRMTDNTSVEKDSPLEITEGLLEKGVWVRSVLYNPGVRGILSTE